MHSRCQAANLNRDDDEDKDDVWAVVYPISIQPPALCPRALPLPLLKLSPRSNYDNGDDDDTLIDGRDINSS